MIIKTGIINKFVFLGSNNDLTVPSDSLRLYSSMPVLEDGLSSGHASDTDNNNPTVRLMKRQITEIEREINQSICKSNQLNKSNEDILSVKNENLNPSPIDMNGCVSSFDEPMTISQTDSFGKSIDLFLRCFCLQNFFYRENTPTSCTSSTPYGTG